MPCPVGLAAQHRRGVNALAVDLDALRHRLAGYAEARDDDHLDVDSVVLRYNGFAAAKLRRLIDAINPL